MRISCFGIGRREAVEPLIITVRPFGLSRQNLRKLSELSSTHEQQALQLSASGRAGPASRGNAAADLRGSDPGKGAQTLMEDQAVMRPDR
jgi:hypothetical protein